MSDDTGDAIDGATVEACAKGLFARICEIAKDRCNDDPDMTWEALSEYERGDLKQMAAAAVRALPARPQNAEAARLREALERIATGTVAHLESGETVSTYLRGNAAQRIAIAALAK